MTLRNPLTILPRSRRIRAALAASAAAVNLPTVSYTHLTLPTSDLV